jgi:hypothetical protein
MEQNQEYEISVKELLQKLIAVWRYLVSKSAFILSIGLFGSVLGLSIALLTPIKYISRISFVADEAKSMNSGLASLAGQFGLDLAGSSGGGIFSGDNLLIFLRSEGLIRQAMLTLYDSSGKVTLADQYASVYKYKRKWAKDEEIGPVDFSAYRNIAFPRKEDSLLQVVIMAISKELSVARPEKKATFVEVSVKTRDELLSKLFVERLVNIGTERYIQSKTKVKAANVALLQKRADSIGSLLNSTTYKAAASQQALVDVNPALRTIPVASEISSREKMMLATIFAEVVKNLELAKFTLSQEMPVIQVVDNSFFPLKKEKESKVAWTLLGGLIAVLMAIIYLLAARWWKHAIK